MLHRLIRCALLATTAGLLAAAPAAAQTEAAPTGEQTQVPAEAPDPETVVARVNGDEITRGDVLRTISQLPAQVRQLPPQMIFPAVIEQIVNGMLVAEAGYEAGLDEDEAVRERVRQAEEQIVQEVYLTRLIEDQLTEEQLREQYQQYLAENPPQDEVSARHILVETEEAANAIIERLGEGADFAQVAQEESIGPSAAQGGDLGFFSRDEMVAPFAEAAFSLEPGEISQEPVQTQFGWHVIKVEDRREAEPPVFGDIGVYCSVAAVAANRLKMKK